jgi:hemerythrin-like domain-containing protein
MTIVINLLGRQHAEVLTRITRDQHRFDEPRVAAAFLDFLASDVVTHFQLEEDILFPELAQIPRLADGPLRVMNAEHTAFRDLLAAASEARERGDTKRMGDDAADLAALLQAHIAKEDGVLFPMALDALSKEQLERIDAALSG